LRHSASASRNANHPGLAVNKGTEARPRRWNDITQGSRDKATVLPGFADSYRKVRPQPRPMRPTGSPDIG